MTFREFKDKFYIRLNPQQEAAVQQVDGPALLLAVPGSGKTTVIVTRLGFMLYCCGISPHRILTVTYTVAATRDMKARFSSVFGDEYAAALQFRTINGICDTIIRHYANVKKRTAFALVQNDGALSGIIRDLFLKIGADYPSDQTVKDVKMRITYCKNMMLTDDEIRELQVDGMDFPAIFWEYRDYMTRSKRMDFDDQLVFAYQALRRHPDILAHFQDKFRYLSVDEAQDTSKIQHAILRLLAAAHQNIFMVGDEDQSIYGFRAAYPQALLAFNQVYPGAKTLLMETNYRSTRAIVEKADAFIQRNQNRHAKHMRTDNAQGEDIRRITLGDYNRQYNYLVKVADNCTRQTAILYRNNDSALPIIDLLEQKNIPYSCRQRESFFFTSPIVRDITDILSFAFDDCNRDLFLKFYYKLDLKIKRTFLADLLHYQPENATVFETLLESDALEPWQMSKFKALQTHFSKLPGLESFAAIQRIVKFMGYGEYLSDQRADTTKLNILLALANQNRDTGALLLRLRELKEILERDGMPDCPFVLSTIHSSKGLEYERVILIDVVDGMFPGVAEPAAGETLPTEDLETLEEERRLFYVGVTRAKKQLELLTYAGRFGEPTAPVSTFIMQLLDIAPEPKPAPVPTSLTRARTRKESPTADQIAAWDKDYMPGTEVTHKKFGRGLLQSRTGNIAVISFREMGLKKVDLVTCLQKDLIGLTYYVGE